MEPVEIVSCFVLPLILVGAMAAIGIWRIAPRVLRKVRERYPTVPKLAAVAVICTAGYVVASHIVVVPCNQAVAAPMAIVTACGCIFN